MARKSLHELLVDQRNTDPFRMAILGFAAIEQALDDGLAEAFDGHLPRELRLTRFDTRVALAQALNLIPDELADPLGRLAALRHDFAHAKIYELTASRAKELVAALPRLKEAVPSLSSDVDKLVHSLKDEEPAIVLMTILFIVDELLAAALEDAKDARDEQAEAMREWWKRKWGPAISQEDIDQMLRLPGLDTLDDE